MKSESSEEATVLGVPDVVTSEQAAEMLGLKTSGAATDTLRRWNVQSVAREPGLRGQNLYLYEDVVQAMYSRPGRGRRLNLARSEGS